MTSIRQYPMVGGTSDEEGLVSYVVDGSWPPFLPFSTITNGHTVRYVATDGTQFEEGYGVKSSGGTLTRATILRTSAGDTDKIDWGTGTRVVYVVPDIDEVYEADDGTFVRMLKAPQVESVDGGDVTRKYRLWSSSGVVYLSVSSEDPFDHILRYNAAATTPTLELDQPTNFAAAPSIAGTQMTSVATAPFATEEQADEGSSAVVVMSPLRVQNTIASYDPAIGNRTERTTAEYTDMIHVGVPSTGDMRKMTLATIDQLMNTPDYDSGDLALNAGPVVVTHGLGSKPRRVRWAITCTSADATHAVGDSITDAAWQTTAADGLTVIANATQIKFLHRGIAAVRTDNTGPTALDLSKWTLRLWAWIGGAAP